MAGPMADPIALAVVPTPFKTPNKWGLAALLVSIIALQGKAITTAQPRTNKTRDMAICWLAGVGKRAVNGVMR